MQDKNRHALAGACYALGSLGLLLAGGIAIWGRRLDQGLRRDMEEWKAATQAEIYQDIADLQERGRLDALSEARDAPALRVVKRPERGQQDLPPSARGGN